MLERVSDRGQAAIELALGVGLLMIPAALVVLGFGPWTERAVIAEAIANEASRAAVLALSQEAGHLVAAEMAANHGLDAAEVRVGWCGSTPATAGGGACSFGRGATIEVTAQVWVPLIVTPWGTAGGIWVTREHSESIDLYRSLG